MLQCPKILLFSVNPKPLVVFAILPPSRDDLTHSIRSWLWFLSAWQIGRHALAGESFRAEYLVQS